MIEDVIRDPEQVQLPIEELSSPLSAQLLEYCEAELLGSEIIRSSETTSSSNRCYEDNAFNNHVCLPPDAENISSFQDNNGSGNVNSTTLMTAPSTSNNVSTNIAQNSNSNFSALFDDSPVDEVDDISASIDFSTSPPFYVPPFSGAAQQEHQFDFSPPQPQIPLTDHVVNGIISPYAPPSTNQAGGMLRQALPPIVEDCLSSVPSYLPLSRPSPSCAFLGPNNCGAHSPIPGNLSGALCGDTSGMFLGSLLELQAPELDFRGDGARMYYPNPNQQILINQGDIQAFNIESQKLLNGPASSSSPLATEVSNFEDSAYKVGKLSTEERKEKIHRYMKKRNERNFSKKIKYACRKTLADSRPRVRGRFAKNDELGEASRPSSSNHDDDDDDEVAVKEEEEVMDSSDIFAHISGLNSFKCNYPIQSWIGPTSGY
ncbi:uncharacterized protein LOC115743389 isoform X2 [Rhodamnia argentea]|uniref:Uncharacterized protein LOC115743389 isoform X2 n=1 Tax=Rhodamnia argentea TaxID=178133 RepID=A0A8B8PH34_9MYRT|nr:uncharacterized protein LOC115743389 isoform X2 [Rhodamnia argentea]